MSTTTLGSDPKKRSLDSDDDDDDADVPQTPKRLHPLRIDITIRDDNMMISHYEYLVEKHERRRKLEFSCWEGVRDALQYLVQVQDNLKMVKKCLAHSDAAARRFHSNEEYIRADLLHTRTIETQLVGLSINLRAKLLQCNEMQHTSCVRIRNAEDQLRAAQSAINSAPVDGIKTPEQILEACERHLVNTQAGGADASQELIHRAQNLVEWARSNMPVPKETP